RIFFFSPINVLRGNIESVVDRLSKIRDDIPRTTANVEHRESRFRRNVLSNAFVARPQSPNEPLVGEINARTFQNRAQSRQHALVGSFPPEIIVPNRIRVGIRSNIGHHAVFVSAPVIFWQDYPPLPRRSSTLINGRLNP